VSNTILAQMYRMPARFYLTVGNEVDEDGVTFLSATLMERAPESGWDTFGDRFGADRDEPCPPQYAHDDVARWGITAVDLEAFDRLLVGALERHLAKVGA
jgi:hypothetical protein